MPVNVKLYDDFALHENERKIYSDKIHFKRHFSTILIENIISQVKSHYPGGLIHVFLLSKILNRKIIIWRNNKIAYVFGKKNGKTEIEANFEESSRSKGSLNGGHWTLQNGNSPRQSSNWNDCLYEVISSQTGIDPADLRCKVVRELRKNPQSMAKFIMASVDPKTTINCMVGGASYRGSGPRDASRVLDASQSGACHPEGYSGHPRGHASFFSSRGSTDSVESYSISRWRSGFLSREDQDLVAHYGLISNSAQDLMYRLNNGQVKVASHISPSEINYYPLPQAQIWSSGQKQGAPENFRSVCLVGKHFLGKYNNPNEDIFVVTFYPII